MSPAPSNRSDAIESATLVESPNSVTPRPKMAKPVKMKKPPLRCTGKRVSTAAVSSAPMAGDERRRPAPQAPMSRMSRAKIGISAVTPPNSVAIRSNDMAPSTALQLQMKRKPATSECQLSFGRSAATGGCGSADEERAGAVGERRAEHVEEPAECGAEQVGEPAAGDMRGDRAAEDDARCHHRHQRLHGR